MFVGALQIIFVIYIRQIGRQTETDTVGKTLFVCCVLTSEWFLFYFPLWISFTNLTAFFSLALLIELLGTNPPPIPQTMSKRFFSVFHFFFVFVVLFFFAYHFQNFMPFYLFYAYHSQLWKSRMSNINWPLYQCGLIINCLSFLVRRLALLHKDRQTDGWTDNARVPLSQ